MTLNSGRQPAAVTWLLVALWIAIACAVTVCATVGDHAWDTGVYATAMRALRAGLDPYRAATAIQLAVHAAGGAAPGNTPYSYVYSPVTLPLLRVLAHVPLMLLGSVYWVLYALAALAQLWCGSRAAKEDEVAWVRFFAPVALFFPGLLANGTVMSGNIAYLLYAMVLLTAWRGHRRGRWGSFYAAVLVASCIKAPLLSLVLLAPLQARKQWVPALVTMVAGVALFAVQPLLWPELFRNYLRAVDLQFQINHDFGCSPAGLFSQLLDSFGLPYSPWGLLLYTAYAVPVFLTLLRFSKAYGRNAFDWQEWFPVLLTGVLLLNPRIMEYDVAPLALPLALIAWRLLRGLEARALRTGAALAVPFALLNIVSVLSWNVRKTLDGILIAGLFVAGAVRLRAMARMEDGVALSRGRAPNRLPSASAGSPGWT